MLSLNILFPVLNEERRLRNGIETTCEYVQSSLNCRYTLTIVDNGSTDRTAEISHELCEKYSFVEYIKTDEKGVGIAFKTGVEKNTADIVGYMDIDLSTEIQHLAEMYGVFSEREEIMMVNASRLNKKSNTSGRKWYRNITSHGLAFLIRVVFGIKATDVICGFKFFRKDMIEKLIKETRHDNGWFYIIELLVRAEKSGMDIYELPVTWVDDYDTTVHVKKLVIYYLKNIFELRKVLRNDFQK